MQKLISFIGFPPLRMASLWILAPRHLQQAAMASPGTRVAQQEEKSFRILLGLTETQPTRWDGWLSVMPGKVVRIEPCGRPYVRRSGQAAGRVMIDRVPVSQPVIRAPGDHDYPAAASDRAGNVWVAYLKFTPNPNRAGYDDLRTYLMVRNIPARKHDACMFPSAVGASVSPTLNLAR